jgi:signal transduction histidine kinase
MSGLGRTGGPGRLQRWPAAAAAWQRGQAVLRRWAHSLRWRLLTLFLLLALASSAVVLLGMERLLASGWQGWARPIVTDYVDRLAAEIGTPPDEGRAVALAARLPVTIRIEGPHVHFDSHPHRGRDRDDDGDDDHLWHDREMRAEGWGLVRTTADGHRITFGLSQLPLESRPRRVGLVTLLALLTMTGGALLGVHLLLRPLAPIAAGVARYGQGAFDQPITVQRQDELGDLAQRINGMAKSLEAMLEAKRGLLLAISHELRSPLTRARLNAELVAEGAPRAALLRDLAEMRQLIDTLLESERIAAGHSALQITAVDLQPLVHEVLETQFPGVLVRRYLQADIGPVLADATRLKLLLRNLMDNALRHSSGAGQPPEVRLDRTTRGELRLTVRDHGPGVPPEQLQRLSEAFYRPDSARQRSTGGVGLGLHLCRLVAEAHGGRLQIGNAEPGLRVSLVWPDRPASGAVPGAATAAAGQPGPG